MIFSVAEFGELMISEGQVICRVCQMPIKWKKCSNVVEHMKSKRHIRTRAALDAEKNGGVGFMDEDHRYGS
jgi:hypothetical protein